MEFDAIQLIETGATTVIALSLLKFLFNHGAHMQEDLTEIKTMLKDLVNHLKQK